MHLPSETQSSLDCIPELEVIFPAALAMFYVGADMRVVAHILRRCTIDLPQHPSVLFLQACLSRRKRDFKAAVEFLQQAKEQLPSMMDGWNMGLDNAFFQDDSDKAVAHANVAKLIAALCPAPSLLLVQKDLNVKLACTLQRATKPAHLLIEDVRRLLEDSLRVDPSNASVKIHLARFHWELRQDYESAQTLYQSCNSSALREKAFAESVLCMIDAQALLYPDDIMAKLRGFEHQTADVLCAMGAIRASQSDPARTSRRHISDFLGAKRHLEDALQKKPTHFNALRVLIEVRDHGQEDPYTTLALFQTARAKRPKDKWVLSNYIRLMNAAEGKWQRDERRSCGVM